MSRLLPLVVLLAGACRTAPAPPAEVATRPEPAVARADAPPGTRDAIGVHGAWTLEVRNPDGTVVERRKFHNDYVDSGNTIVSALAGQRSIGAWYVAVGGNTQPCGDETNQDACYIRSDSGDLSVTADAQNKLVLAGGTTAERDGEISSVSTHVQGCDGSTAPADCSTFSSDSVLTATTLGSTVTILQNQSVYVTVEISFANMP